MNIKGTSQLKKRSHIREQAHSWTLLAFLISIPPYCTDILLSIWGLPKRQTITIVRSTSLGTMQPLHHFGRRSGCMREKSRKWDFAKVKQMSQKTWHQLWKRYSLILFGIRDRLPNNKHKQPNSALCRTKCGFKRHIRNSNRKGVGWPQMDNSQLVGMDTAILSHSSETQ